MITDKELLMQARKLAMASRCLLSANTKDTPYYFELLGKVLNEYDNLVLEATKEREELKERD